LILSSRLDPPGGTERAIANAANLFIANGNKVSILILDEAQTTQSFFELDASILLYSYPLHFGITPKGNTVTRKIAFLNHLRILRKKIKDLDPDIVIGTEYHFTIAARLIAKNKRRLVFGWEHHHFYWIKKNRFWSFLQKIVYPKLDAVITLNKTEQKLFSEHGCNAVVIPNFVARQSRSELNARNLLTVGWLNLRKGVDMIPLVAQKLFPKYPGWKWNIIGSATSEIDLKIFQKEPLVNHINIIPPVSRDIDEVYKQTSVYVMTSRFECLPMVLLEAMSFGVPCVAFDCPTGPADIIQNGINGILVEKENTEAMANAIIDLIENDEKRKTLGANALESITYFSPENIYKLWEGLFSSHSVRK